MKTERTTESLCSYLPEIHNPHDRRAQQREVAGRRGNGAAFRAGRWSGAAAGFASAGACGLSG